MLGQDNIIHEKPIPLYSSSTEIMLRDIKYFFLISRPLNLFISFLSFAVACYISKGKGFEFFQEWPFWGTAITILVIGATGYWINDVYDFRIDRINKPNKTVVNAILSVKKVLTVYFATNIVILIFSALFLGFYLDKYPVTFINLLSIILLFFYASYLKRIGVPGNLTISFLISLVFILAAFLYELNMPLVWTIAFAFQITFIREITKDVEDIHGDLQYELKTLPITTGIRSTKQILAVLYVLFIISCYLPFIYRYIRVGDYLWTYLVLSVNFVQVPTIFILRLMLKSVHPKDFAIQSKYLKYLIFTGIATLFFLK